MLQQKDITIETHESQFGVKIQASEIAGVKVYKISPAQINTAFEGRIFMHAHGGAHFLGGGAMAAQEGAMIAASAGIEVISVDYTLSTEGPFPAALNDLVAVYQELLKTFPASAIAVGGSSAGGNSDAGNSSQAQSVEASTYLERYLSVRQMQICCLPVTLSSPMNMSIIHW